MRWLTVFFVIFVVNSLPVLAEPVASSGAVKRGLITSTTCPYGCREAGLTADICRESRIGDTCRVEDLTQTPGHRTLVRVPKTAMLDIADTSSPHSGRRGLVTTAACPYSCKDAGLSADSCRERQVGDSCEVEDLNQAPGHRTLLRTN